LLTTPAAAAELAVAAPAAQQVVKVRRDYNTWVATETLEDYALRFTPQRFRKWSHARVAHTAFGAASFLMLEAVGATLLVQYGFANAFWAILATGLIIFRPACPSASTPRATGWTWTCSRAAPALATSAPPSPR
jgi:hypothetical protein